MDVPLTLDPFWTMICYVLLGTIAAATNWLPSGCLRDALSSRV